MDAVGRTRALAGRPLARDADAMLAAALASVDPGAWVRRNVTLHDGGIVIAGDRFELGTHARVFVVAIGKAAEPTTCALVEAIGSALCGGLAVLLGPLTTTGFGPVEVVAGGHPLPDAASEDAGRRLLEVCARAQPDDLVVFAISGGSSALACAPIDGITLADLRETTDVLARAGLDIATVNAVRGRLDRCKHGGLLHACAARCVALILVDVPDSHSTPGNARTVGSGPTFAPEPIEREAAIARAIAIVGDALPSRVRDALASPADATPVRACPLHVIGDNATAVTAARGEAIARGYALVDAEALRGEAREIGGRLGRRLAALAAGPRPVACIVGGEPTVTRRGHGRGGRTLELALAAAQPLAGLVDVALVAFATDGRDGSSDAAGAVVDGTTMARASALGLDPTRALADHDTAPLFAALGDRLPSSPTGTNVCDLAILLAR